MNKLTPFFIMSLFLLLMESPGTLHADSQKKDGVIHSEANTIPCTKSLSDIKVTLDINPKPIRAMKPLRFRVTLSTGHSPLAPYIDLNMPGMNMGHNRVKLYKVDEGVYEGEGIVVKCPSGRRTWEARVTVPNRGAVEFIFDVIY